MSATAVAKRTVPADPRKAVKNILVVDDDRVFSESLADGLTAVYPEICVFTARDGKEAVAIMNNVDTIDLVITDLRMPAMDGLELTLWINEIKPRVPVIVTSAYADTSTVVNLATQGNYFFDKPVDFGALARAVDALIN